jgi:hypothetical protein
LAKQATQVGALFGAGGGLGQPAVEVVRGGKLLAGLDPRDLALRPANPSGELGSGDADCLAKLSQRRRQALTLRGSLVEDAQASTAVR